MLIVLLEINDFSTIYIIFPDIKSNDRSYEIAGLIWLPVEKNSPRMQIVQAIHVIISP
jgi:hypothetical protein